MGIQIKRVYDDADPSDGLRVLVDRIWPRGLTKDDARADVWLKDIAPSTELRKWFGHEPERMDEFVSRYRAELDKNDTVDELRDLARTHNTVTLLFSAKDPERNQARVLRDYLEG